MVPTWFHRPVKLTCDVVVGRTRNPLKPEPEAAKSTLTSLELQLKRIVAPFLPKQEAVGFNPTQFLFAVHGGSKWMDGRMDGSNGDEAEMFEGKMMDRWTAR